MLKHGSYLMWNIGVKEILSQCLTGLWNKTSIVINKTNVVIDKTSIVINKTNMNTLNTHVYTCILVVEVYSL
jgi:hypothetical protein